MDRSRETEREGPVFLTVSPTACTSLCNNITHRIPLARAPQLPALYQRSPARTVYRVSTRTTTNNTLLELPVSYMYRSYRCASHTLSRRVLAPDHHTGCIALDSHLIPLHVHRQRLQVAIHH